MESLWAADSFLTLNEPTPIPSSAPLAVDLAALRTLMDERDRRYEQRWDAQRQAVKLALDSQERFSEMLFKMSQEAIKKAEDAQKEYNARSNEFRGQLADQATTFMPRPESDNMFRAQREMIDRVRDEARLLVESLRNDVVTLQRSLSQDSGQKAGRSDFSTPLLMAITAAVVGFLVFIVQRQFSDRTPPAIHVVPSAPVTVIPKP